MVLREVTYQSRLLPERFMLETDFGNYLVKNSAIHYKEKWVCEFESETGKVTVVRDRSRLGRGTRSSPIDLRIQPQ